MVELLLEMSKSPHVFLSVSNEICCSLLRAFLCFRLSVIMDLETPTDPKPIFPGSKTTTQKYFNFLHVSYNSLASSCNAATRALWVNHVEFLTLNPFRKLTADSHSAASAPMDAEKQTVLQIRSLVTLVCRGRQIVFVFLRISSFGQQVCSSDCRSCLLSRASLSS